MAVQLAEVFRRADFQFRGGLDQLPVVRQALHAVGDVGLFAVFIEFFVIRRGRHEQAVELIHVLAEAESLPGIQQRCRDIHFAVSFLCAEALPLHVHHVAVVVVAEEIVHGRGELLGSELLFLVTAGGVVIGMHLRFPVAIGILRQYHAVGDGVGVHDAVL